MNNTFWEYIKLIAEILGFLLGVPSSIYYAITIGKIRKEKEEKEGKEGGGKGGKEEKEKGKEEKEKEKTAPNFKHQNLVFVLMLIAIVLLSIALVLSWCIHPDSNPKKQSEEQDTILVFAGGGSVRNYLMDSTKYGIDVRKQSNYNSINIAMASGSAWRVLAEEFHNHNEISRGNNDSLNRFITICLSADSISDEFYTEYISNLGDVIIAEVYLGEDTLVTYLSDAVKKEWNLEGYNFIQLKTLAHGLQNISEDEENIAVFTTNKMSGTLDQYKKSFKNSKNVQDLKLLLDSTMLADSLKTIDSELYTILKADNNCIPTTDIVLLSELINRIKNSINTRSFVDLEKMLADKKAFTYYENTKTNDIYSCFNNPKGNRPFIILGSTYYKVNNLPESRKGLKVVDIDINNNEIQYKTKPMYLYFLAYPIGNSPEYLVANGIIKFLEEIQKKKCFPLPQDVSKKAEWEKMMNDHIIVEPNTTTKKGRIKRMN